MTLTIYTPFLQLRLRLHNLGFCVHTWRESNLFHNWISDQRGSVEIRSSDFAAMTYNVH